VRIVKWQYKLLYVVAGYVLGGILFRLFSIQVTRLVVVNVFDLALVFLGARIFRGRSEDIRGPRAWWRMTSKRKLSKRLGILFSVFSVVGAVAAILETTAGRQDALAEQFATAAFYAVLAFFYLNCAVRLNRIPRLGTAPSFGVSPLTATDEPMSSAQPEQPDARQSS
jgi:quinol-cytochrome oxidoreductase complex cytochrome b subunit